MLVEMVGDGASITTLDLAGCGIDAEVSTAVQRTLFLSRSLRVLDMSNHKLTPAETVSQAACGHVCGRRLHGGYMAVTWRLHVWEAADWGACWGTAGGGVSGEHRPTICLLDGRAPRLAVTPPLLLVRRRPSYCAPCRSSHHSAKLISRSRIARRRPRCAVNEGIPSGRSGGGTRGTATLAPAATS